MRKTHEESGSSDHSDEPVPSEETLATLARKTLELRDVDVQATETQHGEPHLLRYTVKEELEGEVCPVSRDKGYEVPKRIAFIKRPKSCAEPGAHAGAYPPGAHAGPYPPAAVLPTISEHCVSDALDFVSDYNMFRSRSFTDGMEHRFQRLPGSSVTELFPDYKKDGQFDTAHYFTKSADVKGFSAKGNHPDSLYRVSMSDADEERGVLWKVYRVLRWPAALMTVCFLLALFIYYVMPDSTESSIARGNGTVFEGALAGQFRHRPALPDITAEDHKYLTMYSRDDQAAKATETNKQESTIKPHFPDVVNPQVQYGSERENRLYKDEPIPPTSTTYSSTAKGEPDNQNTNITALIGTEAQNDTGVNFTSGHSKVFGLSVEESRLQATTASSVYHTRVSPTLPAVPRSPDKYSVSTTTWRNVPEDDLSCHSTKYEICKHVLSYDLTSDVDPNTPFAINEDQIEELRKEFGRYNGTGCNKRMLSFLCTIMEPECTPNSQPLKKPCKKFCEDAVMDCDEKLLNQTSLMSLINCAMYPMTNCIDPREPCFENEGSCLDGTCFPLAKSCDGVFDCATKVDERDCHKCNDTHWECQDGACIPTRWLCDGYADCTLGEDEFRCRSGPDGFLPHPIAKSSLPKWLSLFLKRSNREPSYEGAESRVPTYKQLMTKLLIPQMSNNKNKGLNPKPDYLKVDFDSSELLETSDTSSRTAPFKGYVSPGPVALAHMKPQEHTSEVPAKDEIEMFKGLIDDLEKIVDADKWYEQVSASPVSRRQGDVGTAHASPCPEGELRCVDGRCILYSQICDGRVDCSDSADEGNCRV